MKQAKIGLVISILILQFVGYSQSIQREDLASNNIKLSGWAKEYLVRQVSGLTGHPEESGFPFNTGMWTEDLDFRDREFPGGSEWWPYEQTAFYLDGALRCAYMTESEELIRRVNENIRHVINHVDDEGKMHAGNISDDSWALVAFMTMLFEEYHVNQNPELLAAIENHYQSVYGREESFNLPEDAGFSIRSLLHIEHLCKLYEISGNDWYLNVAEKLYATFQNMALEQNDNKLLELSAIGMKNGMVHYGHAFTYSEFVKLTAVLFYYTQKEEYKQALEKAVETLTEQHELASGIPSAVEGLHGKGEDMAHEVCDISSFNWTYGWALIATGDARYADKMEKAFYNAGISSVTSDFRAHQYYSAPNMPISTSMSSFYNDGESWGFGPKARLSYRPGHDTECCSGSVHRIFPIFVNRSVLVEKNGLKLALYLPSTINVMVNNEELKFKQETNYPFDHTINIIIENAPSGKINFDLRIPGWSDSYSIKLNRKTIKEDTKNAFFERISQSFKTGDTIQIEFNTSPKIDKRDKGFAINYGPLVFSYPLKARKRLITQDDGHKASLGFPAYELLPENPHTWAYSLAKDITSGDIEIVETDITGYPWDYGRTPVKLKIPARAVNNWKLESFVSLTKFPDELELEEKTDTLTLEPMGGTLLRITEFPISK